MPYASKKQAAYIHLKAAQGVPWAKKFVADSHGTHVRSVKAKIGKPQRKGYDHR